MPLVKDFIQALSTSSPQTGEVEGEIARNIIADTGFEDDLLVLLADRLLWSVMLPHRGNLQCVYLGP